MVAGDLHPNWTAGPWKTTMECKPYTDAIRRVLASNLHMLQAHQDSRSQTYQRLCGSPVDDRLGGGCCTKRGEERCTPDPVP